jgi:hypothetical protein
MSFFAYAFINPELFSGKSLFFFPRPRPGKEKVLHSLLPISLDSLLPKVLQACCQKLCILICEKLCILIYRLQQGIDYAYTLQGWLKGVNSQHLNPGRDMGNDGHTSSNNTSIIPDAFGPIGTGVKAAFVYNRLKSA